MKRVVIAGAGKIGVTIADLLSATGDYDVTLADRTSSAMAGVDAARVRCEEVDVRDSARLDALLQGSFAVVSALPFDLTGEIASAAKRTEVHYLDLTEDVATTRRAKQLAADARTAFIPQCGLAPGFISIAAFDLAGRFDILHDVRMRVGALPKYASNALSYNLTWSTEGLINEYCEPCEAIVDGKRRETAPLEGLEEFLLDGVRYEAFNTSGGLGTLCETLQGKVRNLNYRSIRYPGHAALMKALLHDLRLRERRDLFKDIMEYAIPATMQDVVIVFVTATGVRGGRFIQETYANKIYSREINGVMRSAIQATTAAGVCGVLDLLAEGKLPDRGFVRQEDVSLPVFLANRFGRLYAQD
ncbi:MAG TPA: saccharopine dehydrogenase C-terminal domain-containing protein [Steroidobacter sp.]|nr:saccharopine dehydrogenase NADP-binding domain-containing protein [Steroidobacteraceae bacterium]HLS82858.1 saccharopine dehydrogenase C-terminal domain-containing protein [Steroidobacter sp.]